jgi:hypothetical protein
MSLRLPLRQGPGVPFSCATEFLRYHLAGETFVERIERGLALDRIFRRDPEQIYCFALPAQVFAVSASKSTVSGLALAFLTAAFL